jgi:hemerythrin-like domain-containing protein
MKITEALLRDHKVFYSQFEDLENALLSHSALPEIESQIDALTASLETHAQLEDELLFAALEPYIGQTGPLAVMRMEHSEIENTFAELQQAADYAATEEWVSHLLQVARPHFAKEEQVLFPTAEQVLDSNTLEQLGAQFSNRRRVVMI